VLKELLPIVLVVLTIDKRFEFTPKKYSDGLCFSCLCSANYSSNSAFLFLLELVKSFQENNLEKLYLNRKADEPEEGAKWDLLEKLLIDYSENPMDHKGPQSDMIQLELDATTIVEYQFEKLVDVGEKIDELVLRSNTLLNNSQYMMMSVTSGRCLVL